jgi:glucose/arabinose dehydrogenase
MKQAIEKFAVVIAAMLTVATSMPAQAQPLAQLDFIDNFEAPVYVTRAPGAHTLLFVVEQAGLIRVLVNEVKQATPFLNIMPLVLFDGGERGLLSMAFHPDYATNRLFYVCYNNLHGDVVVEEFQRRAGNPLRADPDSRRRVLAVIHRDAANHNGGQLQFGPDGKLYISIGDGGANSGTAPNLKLLLGKILRINPRKQGAKAYTIPNDNPFLGTGNRREIFSYGLRNPWRFSFDDNRIAIADVGQNRQEELNFLTLNHAKGTNFGWPQYEGNLLMDNSQPGQDPPKFPMYVYGHHQGGCAIIGGYIADDPTVPAIRNKYLFGDLCTGRISILTPNVPTQQATHVRFTGITAGNLSSFGIGPGNKIYITQVTGQLSRIVAP